MGRGVHSSYTPLGQLLFADFRSAMVLTPVLINESGLYSLILCLSHSEKTNAICNFATFVVQDGALQVGKN